VVPENHARPDGRKIRLPVAMIPAHGKASAVPLVFMEGGPGGAALPTATPLVASGLNDKRDIIIMGQRGTLYAQPPLVCPEVDRANAVSNGLRRNADATRRIFLAAASACRDRFVGQGVEIGAYNTTQSAADFADLRKVLGIAEWDVYGVSYGTDLALTYMRAHPDGVRSVTIDSVVPPHTASVGMNWTNAGNGLANIFAACAAEAACRERFPDPSGALAKVVAALETKPLELNLVPVLIPGEKPEASAKPVQTLVDGAALINWFAGVSELLGPDTPRLIDDLTAGRVEPVAASIAAGAFLKEGEISYGLQYGVVCTEWVPYQSADNVLESGRRAFPAFPAGALEQAPQFPFAADICRLWDVPKAPAAQREVNRSTIPTLVIAGTYDALTSAQTAETVARELPHATSIAIPGVGHFVMPKSPCAQKVMKSFLDNPATPDTSCWRRSSRHPSPSGRPDGRGLSAQRAAATPRTGMPEAPGLLVPSSCRASLSRSARR